MTRSAANRGRAALYLPIGLGLALGVYSQVGPAGVIRRPLPALPIPDQVRTDEGVPQASMDADRWRDALAAAKLPAWSLSPGLEHAAVVRAVELSRAWTEDRDGDALGRVALQLHALGRHKAAIEYALLALELGTDDAKWSYWAGVIAQTMGDRALAIAALKQAAELDASYGVTSARLGTLHFETDRLDEADAAFERASKLAPSQSLGLRGRAEIALRRGDAAAALGYVDGSIALAPGDFRAHRIRAQVLSALGRAEASEAAARQASQLPAYSGWTTFDPRLSEALRASETLQALEMRLSIALQTGELEDAAKAGEAILEARPRSVTMLTSLASIQANRGKTARALELARRAIEVEPTSLSAHGMYCEVAIAAGAKDVINGATEALVALDPGRAASWSIRARGLFVDGRAEDAVTAMGTAMSLEPQSAAHPLMLSQILERAGRRPYAAQVIRDALGRMPQSQELAQRLQQLGQ